jgi:ribonucleotide monophosphatase NagD (HAD superfamily)
VQVLCDLVSSKNGRLDGEKRSAGSKQFTKVFLTNPDLVYADKYKDSRFGPAAFRIMLKSVYEATYGHEMEVCQFGKPSRETFDFAEEMIRGQAERDQIGFSNFYMIGDNPKSDIAGGNAKNWRTILVKTGVFDPAAKTSTKGNDREHPANHVVTDFEAAIDLIWKLEGLR